MKLKKLDIKNLRMFEETSFEFDEKFTILAGINGAGKTTLLNALGASLTVIHHIHKKGEYKGEYNHGVGLNYTDITHYKKSMSFELMVSSEDAPSRLHMHLERKQSSGSSKAKRENGKAADNNKTRWYFDFTSSLPTEGKIKKEKSQPVYIYFSTERSIISNSSNKKADALFGQDAAYADALSGYSPSLPDMARWLHAQFNVSSEDSHSKVRTEALQKAVRRFLPYCRNLRTTGNDNATLAVEKYGNTFDISQLSHGERGILVLVLDIARRLSLANPTLKDPIRTGEGVVLIDEIDLHLHPKWQRKVAKNLCKTFPKCQFIATTHSPQVLGEVTPDQVQMLQNGNASRPARSFGVDSNRLLEDIMDTPPRSQSIDRKVRKITKLVDDKKRVEAFHVIEELEAYLGESDPETTRARTLLGFLELDA